MNSPLFQKVACRSCGAPLELHGQESEGGYVHCPACGSEYILHGRICPYCGTYHEQEPEFCRKCGAGLRRRCPKCQTSNWVGNEYCLHCGAALDILELIAQRHTETTQQRLYQQMDEGEALKEEETTASRMRMERMLADERAYQAAIRRQLLEQKEREKKILTFVWKISAVVIVIIIVIALLIEL